MPLTMILTRLSAIELVFGTPGMLVVWAGGPSSAYTARMSVGALSEYTARTGTPPVKWTLAYKTSLAPFDFTRYAPKQPVAES